VATSGRFGRWPWPEMLGLLEGRLDRKGQAGEPGEPEGPGRFDVASGDTGRTPPTVSLSKIRG
jgi:hypothetical protein